MPEKKTRDVSFDYLRATITLMVLAHHCSLAYTTFAHFDSTNIFNSTAPVVDSARWRFLDYAENFNDVFFMSLMFFVSGLFVFPALRRHGIVRFIRDRLLRLGVPFVFTVTLLMPIAYYASWQLTGRSHGYFHFWSRLASFGFAPGPPWFIWVLLAFDCVIAALLTPLAGPLERAVARIDRLKDYPIASTAVLIILAGLAYLPLLNKYGFGAWTSLLVGAFSFQLARIVLYALWFVIGVVLGSPGVDTGLLARDGPLARRWPVWLAICFIAYNALCFVPRLALVQAFPLRNQQILEANLWVISNVASSLGFIALFRGAVWKRRPWMDSLSRSAYVMYLVHYVYVTWAQRLLLPLDVHASIKFTIVFISVTGLSWLTAQVALRIPILKRIV